MGFSVLGKKQTQEHINKRLKNIRGKTYEEIYGKELAAQKKEKWKDPEYIEKMKIRGKKSPFKETVICPHCKKEGKKGPMHRWHFENCKKRGFE